MVQLAESNAQTYQLGIVTNGTSTNWIATNSLASGGSIARLALICQNPAGLEPPEVRQNYDVFFGLMEHRRLTEESNTVKVTSARVTLNSLTDGIPNTWWETHFGTFAGVSASVDSDRDGFTNAEEYALGTLPQDPDSTFRIAEIQRSGDSLSVTWYSTPGKRYRIQGTTNLGASVWEDFEPIVDAYDGQITTSLLSVSESLYFIRVLLVP